MQNKLRNKSENVSITEATYSGLKRTQPVY